MATATRNGEVVKFTTRAEAEAIARAAQPSAPPEPTPAPVEAAPAPGPRQPLLWLTDRDDDVEAFDDLEGLARRVHELRGRGGLDVTRAVATTGADPFGGLLIWSAAAGDAARRCLAFVAGPGLRTPDDLLTVLQRTRPAPRAAQA